jgi:CDGSH-type Zn-finger protein
VPLAKPFCAIAHVIAGRKENEKEQRKNKREKK